MKLPINNHLKIHPDGRISINGNELLIEEGSMLITGYDDSNEITKVMLTLVPSTITIEQGDNADEDDSPEPSIGTAFIDVQPRFVFTDDQVRDAGYLLKTNIGK